MCCSTVVEGFGSTVTDGNNMIYFECFRVILLCGVVYFTTTNSAFITAGTNGRTYFTVGVLVLSPAVAVVPCFNHCVLLI